jgi:hypothetical protein
MSILPWRAPASISSCRLSVFDCAKAYKYPYFLVNSRFRSFKLQKDTWRQDGFLPKTSCRKGCRGSQDKNTTLANVQISVMLHAIFPRTSRLPNVMGPGSSLDSGGMIGFALFYVISEVAVLGWTVGKAGGLGPCCPPRIYNTWLGLRFLMLGAANCATFACNAALFPKFIAGKRGFFVYAAISSAIHPWYLRGLFSGIIPDLLLCNHRRPPLQLLPDCTWFPEHAGLPHSVEMRV